MVANLYHELRALAHSHLRRERDGHSLGTTALVHEAWLRLASQHSLRPESATRFFAIASTTMRRVLVDYARKRRRAKRGGGVEPMPLETAEAFLSDREVEELVALDDALERLGRLNARAAGVVVHRFFGGLSEAETARTLGVSLATVQRDWAAARAWLRKEVARDLGILPPANGMR